MKGRNLFTSQEHQPNAWASLSRNQCKGCSPKVADVQSALRVHIVTLDLGVILPQTINNMFGTQQQRQYERWVELTLL